MIKETNKINGLLEFNFNEHELIQYLCLFKSKLEKGEIKNDSDIADFVMC